jgi:outer membrane protein assembly factor BamB
MSFSHRAARRTAALVSILLAAQTLGLANDWPQWRGPRRDGAATFKSPARWPEKLKLKWKTEVGHGDASPVTAGRRVFLFTNQGQREVVTALSLEDGKTLWRDSYAVAYTPEEIEKEHGRGPKATPVLDGGRLYTVGVTGVISAYDAAGGQLLWRKEPKGGLREGYPLFGMAVSPLVAAGLLVAPVGGSRQMKLTAFDARTGEVRWQWGTENLHPDLGLGYSSPVLAEFGGVRQVVFWTGRDLVGLAPQTGQPLWVFPFKSEWDSVVTPVLHERTIILSANPQGTVAVRINKRGDSWAPEQVWQQAEVFPYMTTPVAAGKLLYGLSAKKKGQFFCLDLETGKTLWLTEGRDAENAALLSAGEYLFVLTDAADLIVARQSGKGFESVGRYRVADSPTWAHPVLLHGQILVKDASTLALWSLGG